MTYAGLANNAELNLGTGGGTHAAHKVHEWFEHFWALSDPYDLCWIFSGAWEPHTPWSIYLHALGSSTVSTSTPMRTPMSIRV